MQYEYLIFFVGCELKGNALNAGRFQNKESLKKLRIFKNVGVILFVDCILLIEQYVCTFRY